MVVDEFVKAIEAADEDDAEVVISVAGKLYEVGGIKQILDLFEKSERTGRWNSAVDSRITIETGDPVDE